MHDAAGCAVFLTYQRLVSPHRGLPFDRLGAYRGGARPSPVSAECLILPVLPQVANRDASGVGTMRRSRAWTRPSASSVYGPLDATNSEAYRSCEPSAFSVG